MSQSIIHLLFCLETYRTPEQTYSEEDYVVDGIKLLNLPFDPAQDSSFSTSEDPNYIRDLLSRASGQVIKDILNSYRTGPAAVQEKLTQVFPRASKIIREGQPHWFHVTTEHALSKRPQEFNSGGFSEAELLGTSDSESEIEAVSIYFNSEGDEIEAPPDKFMLSIGAA